MADIYLHDLAVLGEIQPTDYIPFSSDPEGTPASKNITLEDFVSAVVAAPGFSHSHSASDITSGTISTARLGSGTANSGSFLRGDSTWATVDLSPYLQLAGGTMTGALIFTSGVGLNWSSTSTTTGAIDLSLLRDAAGTLALRNSTNAQTFRVYGTYTDSSNYVRASLSASATTVALLAETAGTGQDTVDLVLKPAGAVYDNVWLQMRDSALGQYGFRFRTDPNCENLYAQHAGVETKLMASSLYGLAIGGRSTLGLGLGAGCINIYNDNVYTTGLIVGAGSFAASTVYYGFYETFNGSGQYTVTGLTAGDYYAFEFLGNITSLVNGSQTLTAAGVGFVAQGTSVVLNGPANQTITGRFQASQAYLLIGTKDYTTYLEGIDYRRDVFIHAHTGGGNSSYHSLRGDINFDARRFKFYVAKESFNTLYVGNNVGYEVLRIDEDNQIIIDPNSNASTLLKFGGSTSSYPALKRSSTELQVRLANDSGFAGLKLASLTFDGQASQTSSMARHTTADTAGNTLTVQAGGATVGATDKAGGYLDLIGGIATGTGESGVRLKGYVAGSSGTADCAASTVVEVLGNKLGFFGATPIAKVTTGISGATHVDNGGDSVHDNDTFGGYTIAQLFKACIDYGLLT